MLFLWVEIPLLADIYFLFSVQGSWTPDLYFANTESVLCNSKSNIDDRSSWHTQREEIFQVWQIWALVNSMIMDRKTNSVRNMSCESAGKWRADWTSTSRRRRRGWLNKCSAEPVSSNQRSCKKSQHCPRLRFISQLNLIKMVYWSLMSATCIQNQNNELVKILNQFWWWFSTSFVEIF